MDTERQIASDRSSPFSKLGKPIVPTASLRGTPVRNKDGDDLGVLRDLMIETNRGTIAYAILTFEDDKSYALPFGMLQIDPESLTIQTDLQPEVFELGHSMMRIKDELLG